MSSAVDDIIMNGCGKTAVAINPEKIIKSRESQEVFETLLSADILYLDGIGAVKVAEQKLQTKLSRIPGCELWEQLMIASSYNNKSVFLVGAEEQVVSKTKSLLEDRYNVNVVGYANGFFENENHLINEILDIKPDIVSVALGSPKQELFMQKCRDAGVESFMMGVGGTYNVFTGSVNRAPDIFCKFGLEWAYRLLKEPSRVFRQTSLLKFIFLAFRKKL